MESHQRKQLRLITVRTAVLALLLALPVAVCAVAGALAIWKIGWTVWLWWIIPAFWILTWVVAKLWRAPQPADAMPLTAGHWTPRDQRAAEIVQRYQKQLDELAPAQLSDMHFYLNQSQKLADEMARHYHPDTTNPVNALTVPEIVAAIRLVADDLERLVLDSIPGSRLLTVGQWKALGKAPKWIRRASNTAWAAAILINPFNIARYGSSRVTSEKVAGSLQNELLATIYLRFIRQVGFYVIEMNSGRLRGGADAWRTAFEKSKNTATPDPVESTTGSAKSNNVNQPAAVPVKIVIIGQTSAGKSSLINLLIGRARASVNILPETADNTAYEFDLETTDSKLTLADTPGYSQAGASTAQTKKIQSALYNAHLILLVMDAHTPARDADKKVLTELRDWFRTQPHLQIPPVIGVLTHVDLLPPPLLWNPPYPDWQTVDSPKSKSIAGAVDYTNQVLSGFIAACVPVCTDADPNRQWGVSGNLLPAIVGQLDQARSVSVVAAFEGSLNRDRLRHLLKQATSSGRKLLQTWLDERINLAD